MNRKKFLINLNALQKYMDDRHIEGENQDHRNLPKKIGTGSLIC